MMLDGTGPGRGSARWLLLIAILLALAIPCVPGVSGQQEPTVSRIGDTDHSVSLYYGAGASQIDHWVETSILFRNQHPNSTTIFMMQPSEYVYDNGTPSTGAGWYVRLRVLESDGSLHADLGHITDDTVVGDLDLDPLEVYTLQARLHVPEGLVVGEEYKSTILVGGRVPVDPENPGAVSIQSFTFITRVHPTLSYHLSGRVYRPNGWDPAPGARVEVTNLRSGDTFSLVADSRGRYVYDIEQFPNGYMDRDALIVKASYDGMSGTNGTSVNIITDPVLGEYGTGCDIFLEEPSEEGNFFLDNWLVLLVLAVLVIVILFQIVGYRSRDAGATRDERELRSDLKRSQREIKTLKRTISRREAELGKRPMKWSDVRPEDEEGEPPSPEGGTPTGADVDAPTRKGKPGKVPGAAPASERKKRSKRRPRTPPVAPAAVRRKRAEDAEEEAPAEEEELPEEITFEVPDWLERTVSPEAEEETPERDVEEQPWLEPDEDEPESATGADAGFVVPKWLEKEMASIPEERAARDVGFEDQPWLEPEEEPEPEEIIGGEVEPEEEGSGFDDLIDDLEDLGDDEDLDDLDLDLDEGDLEEDDLAEEDLEEDDLGPLIVEEADEDLDLEDEMDIDGGTSSDEEFREKAKDIEALLDELD